MSLQPPTTLAGWLVWIVGTLAILAIAWLFVVNLGLPIPAWFIHALFIAIGAVFVIWLIRAVASQ